MGKINEYSAGAVDANVNLLGSGSAATEPTKQFKINDINTYFMGTKVSVPATAVATGTAGDYAVESGYAYFCVATDTWERVAIATW